MNPVILSGGVGSRLWPLSRGMYPKQLLPIAHPELSLLQQTVQRAQCLESIGSVTVVCNDEHRFIVAEQLLQINTPDGEIILEPDGRNTAPAITLAALQAAKVDPDQVLLVMPADHIVRDVDAFTRALELAEKLATDGHMVTFGVVPLSPETGYGYIKRGNAIGDGGYSVAEFREKPSETVAMKYLESGDYFWNGGIFVFKASTYLNELAKYEPDVLSACEHAVQGARKDLDFVRVDDEAFAKSPSISIDYAVMERTDKAVVVPIDVGWSDVGSWSAYWEVSDKDADGNACHGDVMLQDTRNSHIYAQTKLVAAVGVDDLTIVETDDAILVAHRGESQQIKAIVERLNKEGRSQVSHHRKVYRPWGWYDSIDFGPRFQVKRIMVKPKAKLSVQMHNHRSEHWVVVSGVAEVLNGDSTMTLKENQSTYIPIGTTHALRNPSATVPLEIIEVQTGSYLGEDDIVRFEDNYGRV